MATYTRAQLIANGYGDWAAHVLRGALEDNARETFTDAEVVQTVAEWLTTPQQTGGSDVAAFRTVVMPVGENPQEGDVVMRYGDEWVAEPLEGLLPASATGFRGPWAPTTAYKARELVIAPAGATARLRGRLVSANADFTSGASFSAANWTLAEHAEAFTGAFAATTDYTAGQVVSYLGQLYSANADFTSGASFLLSDWTPLSTQDAATVVVTPAGSLTQSNVQAALQALAVRSDSVESSSGGSGAGGPVHQGVPVRSPNGGRIRLPQLNPAARVGGPLPDTTFLLAPIDEQQLLDEQILLRASFQNALDEAQIRSTLVDGPGTTKAALAGANTAMAVPLDGIMPLDQWTIEFAAFSPSVDLASVTNKAVFAIISKGQQLVVVVTGGVLSCTLTRFAGPDFATDTAFPGGLALTVGQVPADTWARFAIVFNGTGPSMRVIRGANAASLNSTVTAGAPWGSGIVDPWSGNICGGTSGGSGLIVAAQSVSGTFGGLKVADLRISRYRKTYGEAQMVKPPTLSIDASTAQGPWPTGVAGVVEQYTGIANADLDPTVRDIQLGALRDAGCKMIRISDIHDIAEVTAVTPLTINYTLMDARYDRYTGMDFNLTLCYCPPLLRATPGNSLSLPTDNAKLAAYYSAVVTHLKARYPGRLRSLAFWNEPPGFLLGTKAAWLATELAVAQQLNTDHPDIPLGGTDQGWIHEDVSTTSGTGYQKALIDQRAANALPLGALFLHDYTGDEDTLRRTIKSIRAYAVTKGYSAATPVRVTEWSYTISASGQSAAPYSPASLLQFINRADMAAFAHMYMARMIAEGVDIGGLLRIGGIHDSIIPAVGGVEDVFGLFDNTGRPWPVWATFMLMFKHAGNKVAASGNGFPGLRALASKATDGRIMVTYSSYRPWKPNARRNVHLEWSGLPVGDFTWEQWAMDRSLDGDGRPALVGSGDQDDLPLSVDIAAVGVGGIEITPP